VVLVLLKALALSMQSTGFKGCRLPCLMTLTLVAVRLAAAAAAVVYMFWAYLCRLLLSLRSVMSKLLPFIHLAAGCDAEHVELWCSDQAAAGCRLLCSVM
jgi:hypothetical protein